MMSGRNYLCPRDWLHGYNVVPFYSDQMPGKVGEGLESL